MLFFLGCSTVYCCTLYINKPEISLEKISRRFYNRVTLTHSSIFFLAAVQGEDVELASPSLSLLRSNCTNVFALADCDSANWDGDNPAGLCAHWVLQRRKKIKIGSLLSEATTLSYKKKRRRRRRRRRKGVQVGCGLSTKGLVSTSTQLPN